MQLGIIATFTILFFISLVLFRYDYKLNYANIEDEELPIEQVKFSSRNLIKEEIEQKANY